MAAVWDPLQWPPGLSATDVRPTALYGNTTAMRHIHGQSLCLQKRLFSSEVEPVVLTVWPGLHPFRGELALYRGIRSHRRLSSDGDLNLDTGVDVDNDLLDDLRGGVEAAMIG